MASIPFLRYGDLTIPAAKAINAAASPRGVSAAAERSVIPLVYGEDRIKALIVNVLPATTGSSTLLVQCLWCYGGESVNDVRLNERGLPVGATITNYTGVQTTPDAALVTAFAAQGITYTDTLAGLMYSVIAMPTAAFDGQLDISARIRGRALYDPRQDSTAGGSGAQRLATPSTWAWSDNPALMESDFIRNTVYGLGRAVDQSTVPACANACDALIGSPSEKRRICGVSFTQAVSASDIAETLRAYAGCFLLPGPNGIKLVADVAGSSVATYLHASGSIASISDLQRADIGNLPTAVEVFYTDTAQIPWREASAVASLPGAGTTRPWRLSQIRLPGIKRYTQALREATERLAKLSSFDVSCTLEVFDEGITHEEGDIITVTHPIGLNATTMRIASVEMPAPGKWRLRLSQHSAGSYSTLTPSTPVVLTPGFTNPVGPPANVSGLSGVAGDGVITWSWTAIDDRNYAETQLRLGGTDWASATPLWAGRGTGLVQQVATPGTYTIRARHVLNDGQLSVGTTSASATVTAVSGYVPDLTPPPTPTGLAAVSLFRGILIEWTAPTYTVGHGNDFTEVYVATYGGTGPLPTIPATPVGQSAGKTNYFVHDAAMGSQLHVWIRYRTVDGVQGPAAGGTNGLQITVGRVGNSDLGPLIVEAGNLADGTVTAAKLAAQAVDLTKFAAGIEPVSIVVGSTLPTTLSTRQIFLTGTSKMYRWNGAAYVATVPSTDITGQLTDSQIAAIAAAKLTGQITATQITDGAISTPKLAAGSVTTAVLAADAVTADKIAANAVTASEIAAGAVTAGKIAANAVTAAEIAADAVTAGKIAAGAVSAAQIAAGAIQTDKLLVTGRGAALNDDPNTQDGSAWGLSQSSIAMITGAPVGNTAIQIAGGFTFFSRSFPVSVLKRYKIRIAHRASAGGATLTYGIRWLNGSGGEISITQLLSAAAVGTSWASASSGELTPPAGAVNAQLRLVTAGSPTVSMQDIRAEEYIGADLIVDGAIIAGKIAAGAIAVGSAAIADGAIRNALIENLAVDNAKIANLDAAKINTGFLAAARIQSGTIDATKINSNGLTIRDTSGNVILGSGFGLPLSYAPEGTLNSRVAVSGGNRLSNPLWLNHSLSGWGVAASGLSLGLTGDYSGLPTYRLNGNEGAYMRHPGAYVGDGAYMDVTPQDVITASAGRFYQFSVRVNTHRSGVELYGYFVNTSGSVVGSFFGYPGNLYSALPANGTRTDTYIAGSGSFANNGQFEDSYIRLYFNAQAPAGAVRFIPAIRMFQAPGQADNYAFLCRAMACEVGSIDAAVAPYDTGGGVFSGAQQITSSNVSTYIASAAIGNAQIGELNANKITAGSITTDRLQVGSVSQYTRGFFTSSAMTVTSSSFASMPLTTVGMFTRTITGRAISVYVSGTIEINILGSGFTAGHYMPEMQVWVGTDSLSKLWRSRLGGQYIVAGMPKLFMPFDFTFVTTDVQMFPQGVAKNVRISIDLVSFIDTGTSLGVACISSAFASVEITAEENKV